MQRDKCQDPQESRQVTFKITFGHSLLNQQLTIH